MMRKLGRHAPRLWLAGVVLGLLVWEVVAWLA